MDGGRQIPLFTSRGMRPEGGPDSAHPASAAGEAPPGSAPEVAVPVSRLNAQVRRLLEGRFPALWVSGEVANWRPNSSGHLYFSLRDESAQLNCVMFRSDARRLPAPPEEGMEVEALGRLSLYEPRGAYQLVVRRLEARGDGLWRLAFERLRSKLAAEGLLDPARKRPLPAFPARVGVVTSPTGAALRDILTVIRRRAPWTDILVAGCRVQGDGAGEEIRLALERLGRHPGVDVVILTRGGGSVEDLWCFNEEPVARAVASCPVPVISAVGHEVDVTIVDLVADLRAATPSAAAERAVPDIRELRARFRRMRDRLERGLRERAERGAERARRAEERLLDAIRRRLERWESGLARAGGRLDALSPLSVLRRGYAVPLDGEGGVLRGIDDFREDAAFRLRVVDGVVPCRAGAPRRLEEVDDGE